MPGMDLNEHIEFHRKYTISRDREHLEIRQGENLRESRGNESGGLNQRQDCLVHDSKGDSAKGAAAENECY